MSQNTKIEWADDSVSFWWGCTHDGPGCLHCYAETLSKRSGQFWGPRAPRLWIKSAAAECERLNRKAEREGKPRIVFVNSMSDFFEDHSGRVVSRAGNPMYTFEGRLQEASSPGAQISPLATLDDLRREAFHIFDECQWLRFLLLTKRPENIPRMWCSHANTDGNPPSQLHRSNVWLGTSIATQEDADRNIPLLLKCRELSPVLFLSCEPLLGPVCLGDSIYEIGYESGGVQGWVQQYEHGIDLVIVGGESGHGARPMHPAWVRSLRDQCQRTGTAFFFKQWGEYGTSAYMMDTGKLVFRQFATFDQWVSKASSWVNGGICLDSEGNRLNIGADFMAARDAGRFPVTVMHRLGKKAAGRLLDGVEWNQFPEVSHAAR